MNTAKTVWTAKEEALLAELTERKQRVMGANRDRLEGAINTALMDTRVDSGEYDGIVSGLIGNAEAMRDALLPFDSREQRV